MNIQDPGQELFEDLIGQSSATALLNASLQQNKINNAYLFTGPNGIGRRLAALRFLEGLLNNGKPSLRERKRLQELNHPDFILIEPTYLYQGKLIPQSNVEKEGLQRRNPPQIRLEQIRSISTFLSRQPLEAQQGMVMIDSVESMAENASNALLKTLEEPGNAVIILISSRPECLLSTIRSRCQKITFSRLNENDVQKVCLKSKGNNIKGLNIELLKRELIYLANGSPGELINHFKSWQEIPPELWSKLQQIPDQPIEALSLAREINEALNIEQQIWLIDFLEQHVWNQNHNQKQIHYLEKLRRYLLSFVQPRLAWEVTLLELMPSS